MLLSDLVFVGFNSRVAALRRDSGELVWQWKSRKGSGYVTLLLDGDRLLVSVQGYTYCLDPISGAELWFNPLPGFGVGVTSLASINGSAAGALLAMAASDEERRHDTGSTAD